MNERASTVFEKMFKNRKILERKCNRFMAPIIKCELLGGGKQAMPCMKQQWAAAITVTRPAKCITISKVCAMFFDSTCSMQTRRRHKFGIPFHTRQYACHSNNPCLSFFPLLHSFHFFLSISGSTFTYCLGIVT